MRDLYFIGYKVTASRLCSTDLNRRRDVIALHSDVVGLAKDVGGLKRVVAGWNSFAFHSLCPRYKLSLFS